MPACREVKESAGRPVKGGQRLWTIVSLVAFLVLPTAGKAEWEAEWEKAVAAAKKEGKLIAEVSSDFVRNYRPLAQHFERKFGVKATLQGGGRGSDAANRVIAEANAGLYNVDYFGQGTTSVELLVNAGLLAPVADSFILPEVKDPSLWWGGKHWYSDLQQKYSFQYAATHRGVDMAHQHEFDPPGRDRLLLGSPEAEVSRADRHRLHR